MARTAIPLNVLAANGSIVAPTTTAVDQTNGMSLTFPPSTAIPSSPSSELCFLVVSNTSGAQKNVLVRTTSFLAGAGRGFPDLSIPVGAGATRWIGPLEFHSFRPV